MLEAVIEDGGQNNVSAIARLIDMPIATAHRQVVTLVAEGYLTASTHGRHVAGPRLLGLVHRLDEKQVIANVAAPVLHRLAGRVRSVVQLGTLENEMVTYRIKTGHGMQLEAYCSGIGKMLLAHLPDAQRESYLAGGPFVPLTPNTIVDPIRLAAELDQIREQGFAQDKGEIVEGLVCMAVPVCNRDGGVLAAISVSQVECAADRIEPDELLGLLSDAANEIQNAVFN